MPLIQCVKSAHLFHACITTVFGFHFITYNEAYTSPIENTILKSGILNINTFSIFTTALFVGGLFGSAIVGPTSEWLGVKTSIIISSQLGTLGCMFLVWQNDTFSMILGRMFIGIYMAFLAACLPVYNAEVSTPSIKSFSAAMLGVSLRLGILLIYILGIWFGNRWLAIINMITITIVSLSFVLFLPESPRWLRKNGWNERADQACEYFYESSQDNTLLQSEEIRELEIELSQNDTLYTHMSLAQKIKSYFVWPVMRPLFICISVHFLKVFSGHQYLMAYSAHTLGNAIRISPRVAELLYPVSLLIGAVLFLWVIQKVHWKKLLLATTFVQILTNGLMSLTFYMLADKYNCTHNTHTLILCNILQYILILLLGIYGFAFGLGWGSMSWWLYGHILHHHYIRISAGIVNLVLYSGILFNQLIGPMLTEYFGAHILFLIYAVVCIMALLIQLLY